MSFITRVLAGVAANATGETVVQAGRRLTGAQVRNQVFAMTRAIRDLGLRPGDRVAYLHGNTVEAVIVRLALQAAGCCYIGLHPAHSIQERIRFVMDSEPAAFVFDADRSAEAAALAEATDVPRVLSVGPAAIGEDLARLASRQSGAPLDCADRPDLLATITFSSGTTGHPKGVAHTFTSASGFLDHASYMYGPPPWRFLVAIPMADLGGEIVQWTLACGGTVILQQDFDPAVSLAIMERERVTHFFASPRMLYELAEHPAVTSTDLSGLRRLVYGGILSSPSRVARAADRLGPVLLHNYGLRELGFVSFLTPEDHLRPDRRLLRSVGRPVPGVRVAIRGPDGSDLPPGAVGEVCVRSPTMMVGYWRWPDHTAEMLREGWAYTGDIGRVDEEGYLYLVDRAIDVMLVDGHRVYSGQIEQVLDGHPYVREAAVTGLPDPAGGHRVHAFVIPAATIAGDRVSVAEDLRRLVRDALGPAHVPANVHFVPSLPLTPQGKPDKRTLRAQAEQGNGGVPCVR